MSDVMKADTRITDPDIQSWLNTKKNKSDTTRKALRLLYQAELQQQYSKQDKKIVISDV